jgi:hypothetical protein
MIEVLTAEEFQNRKRERRMIYEYYFEEVDDSLSLLPRARFNLSNPEWLATKSPGQQMMVASAVAGGSIDLLTLGYSAGSDLASLRAFYPSVVEAWLEHEKFHHAYAESPSGASSTAATYALLGDAFDVVNRMISFGILLGWGKLLPPVARIIEYRNPYMDAMLERILAYNVPNRDTSLTECTRDLPYVKTLKIFGAKPDARPALMAEYLENWYQASRSEWYYESHKRDTSFKGYWSWEAAAITFLLNIDDRSYRTAEFYPADLVDFARSQALK